MDTTKKGIYVLTRDVTNPDSDRRYRHQFGALVTWKAGTRLLYWPATERRSASLDLVGGHGSISENHEGWEALISALEPETPSVRNTLEAQRGSVHASDILQRLVDLGRISLADVSTLIDTLNAEDTIAYDAGEAAREPARQTALAAGKTPHEAFKAGDAACDAAVAAKRRQFQQLAKEGK